MRLGLSSADEVEAAFDDMRDHLGERMRGAVLQPMAEGGVEVIAGFLQDPAFGPQVLFGLGGVAVELLGDHATRLAPLTDRDARSMVLGLHASPLLTGYRGSAPVDIDGLVDLLLRVGRLAEEVPELAEMDANPVIVTAEGPVVVDARLRVTAAPVAPLDDTRHLSR